MQTNAELLKQYPTLPLLQASPVWKEMRIRDRIGIINAYKERKEMGNETISSVTLDRPENNIPSVDGHPKEQQESVRKNETFSLSIELNDSQLAAVNLAKQGKSFVLTGAAGSGKTTTERALMAALIAAGYLPKDIAAGAFTRVATGNTRKAIFKDPELKELLRGRIHTLHKHLEFAPEYYTDLETGKNKMRFIEQRNESNPFSFRVLIIDEAPMCDLLLYQKLYAAMREGTVVIFIGDINQLPPVFGKSIFNYALHQLPVIELNKIYRQADDSGVLQNAWRILDGLPPIKNKDTDIIWWDETKTKKMGQGRAAMTLGKKDGFFHKKFLKGEYNPLTDIILSPWNKQEMGTDAINAWIAQFLGDERKAIVHEILAGRNKVYLAIGDLVLVDKQLCKITNIEANPGYAGKAPKMASQNLLRIGHYRAVDTKDDDGEINEDEMIGYADINVDEIADDERKNQASAIVSYVYADITPDDKDPDEAIVEYQLQTAGDFAPNGFSLGYATTCHKAQGSEWRKVFILMHEDHSTKGAFISREWIYTATTRAREKLVYIAKAEILEKAVNNQVIRGKNLEEKIQHINAKASQLGDINDYPVIKKGEWESFDDETEEPEVIRETVRVSLSSPAPKEIKRFSDFSQYVPLALKAECQRVLKAKWEQAKTIWGDSIGDCPTISYDCQRGSIIGIAHPAKHHIKLNPVYLAGAGLDIRNHIINRTIPHEICHLVTARYVNMTGHGKDWEMAMRLMQEKPNQYWDGPNLPDWKELAKELLQNPDAVIEDDNLIDGEEE